MAYALELVTDDGGTRHHVDLLFVSRQQPGYAFNTSLNACIVGMHLRHYMKIKSRFEI